MMDGVLLTLADVKKNLGIDHTSDDAHLSRLIMDAESAMTRYIGVQIQGQSYTELFDGGVSKFFLHRYPVEAGSVTITDLGHLLDATDDEVLTEDEDYRVDRLEGTIYKIASQSATHHVRQIIFGSGKRRWQVEYTAGLEFGDDWYEEDQFALRKSLRYLVTDLYNNPDPRISQERFGTGTGVSLDRADIPARIKNVWDDFKVDVLM